MMKVGTLESFRFKHVMMKVVAMNVVLNHSPSNVAEEYEMNLCQKLHECIVIGYKCSNKNKINKENSGAKPNMLFRKECIPK